MKCMWKWDCLFYIPFSVFGALRACARSHESTAQSVTQTHTSITHIALYFLSLLFFLYLIPCHLYIWKFLLFFLSYLAYFYPRSLFDFHNMFWVSDAFFALSNLSHWIVDSKSRKLLYWFALCAVFLVCCCAHNELIVFIEVWKKTDTNFELSMKINAIFVQSSLANPTWKSFDCAILDLVKKEEIPKLHTDPFVKHEMKTKNKSVILSLAVRVHAMWDNSTNLCYTTSARVNKSTS